MNPQMWQLAVPVSGSSARQLAQPFVPQKSWLAVLTAWVRRRMRRMEEARPVADEVAERDIMVILLVLSGAPRSRSERSAAQPGLRFLGSLARNDGCYVSARWAGSVVWAL